MARTAAIDCCSCRHRERSRRCFLRCAAPVTGCSLGSIEKSANTKRNGHAWDRRLCCCVLLCVVVCCCVLLCGVVWCCCVLLLCCCVVVVVVGCGGGGGGHGIHDPSPEYPFRFTPVGTSPSAHQGVRRDATLLHRLKASVKTEGLACGRTAPCP